MKLNKVLFVIDYIEGIAKTGACAQYLEAHPEIIENTNTLINAFRAADLPIFFIRLAFDNTYTGLPKYAPTAQTIKENKKFLIDQPDAQFIAELNFKKDKDFVFNKKYGDPFHGSGLLEALVKLKIEEIIFTGISTNNAILFGANTAMINNFKVLIVEDACGAPTTEQHTQALSIMKGRTANEILTTKEVLDRLEMKKR